MNEEQRAALHRQNLAARAAAERARLLGLAGDPAAAQAVRDAWQPLVDARLDAQVVAPPEPVEVRPAWMDRVPADVELPERLKPYRH